MAERSRIIANSKNTDTSGESAVDKVAEVMRIVAAMDYPELLRLRDLIGQEYLQKAEAAKVRVIAEAREKFEQLGLSFEEVAESQRKSKQAVRAPAVAKYKSPDGKLWSGRGATPKWIREIEEGGGSRDEYLIKEADENAQISL